MNTQFDLVIIGGGIVGLTLARCLRHSQLKIAIIEINPPNFNWDNANYDLRVSAINRATEIIFKNIDIWPAIKAERYSPYQFVEVYDTLGKGKICFNHRTVAEPNLGYIIENRIMHQALWQAVKSDPQQHFFTNIPIEQFWHREDGIHLRLQNGLELQTTLLVGADGTQSWLRREAGFEVQERSYEQDAVVCNLTTELPHKRTAREWFLPDSILAFLPLANAHSVSIVWSTSASKAKSLCEMDDSLFKLQVADASQLSLGGITQVSSRLCFPLIMRHATDYVKPNLAIIGDAAHTFHPLAGQGVNLGIIDAACLAEIISENKIKGRNIGHLHMLRKYQRWRRGENAAMIMAMSGFKELFAYQFKPLVFARSFSLNLTDKVIFCKNLFAKKALGVIGDLPKIAQMVQHDS